MSANNQILVKEHDGKFYVFDVMAETWGEWDENNEPISDINYLLDKEAMAVFDTRSEAHKYAHDYDNREGSEYGVVDDYLSKDGAEVIVVASPQIDKGSK